ncbi:conserved Plasmodium protein, unknown function [Plasmodium gallinaceum]|uniref:Uncharacterized protein n=1 Tax=Plasmodium gallinaceum TaxID=5849 RepID=A0A1J1GPX1_PLAGA|nr:conserved Plasmodium protein, unknown function [Plasmodium gallinaceum]CRG94348.1 conserved Plasmodium protein, unknown function [Plasmodium gallinaceum]
MMNSSKRFYINLILLNKKVKFSYNREISSNSIFYHKNDLIKVNEEINNLEEAFIRRISKMNNTALAYACEDINKNKINNLHIWKLIYNRTKEISNSFSLSELVVMFHAYCRSISFDQNFINLINLFWSLIENKLNDLDYLSLIALYFCAEKTKNSQKMEEISNLLLKNILHERDNIKLKEKGLMIILKILCDDKKKIDEEHIKNICNIVQKVDIKEIKNILLCMQFFLKYKAFDEPFIILLKKIQSLLIFKKINPYDILKHLYYISNINNPIILEEVKNTLSIIYLSHSISKGQ